MSTQTLLGQSFPTPCKRCGGALYRQVDYCPYCGEAHPLDPAPHKRVATPSSRTSAMSKHAPKDGLDLGLPTGSSDTAAPAAGSAQVSPELPMPVLVSPDAPIPPMPNPPNWARTGGVSVRKVLLGILAVVAIGLAYVGYELFGSNQDAQNNNGDQSADTAQDARTTTGTISPYAPSVSPASKTTTLSPTPPAKPAVQAAPSIQPIQPIQPAQPVQPTQSTQRSAQMSPPAPTVPTVVTTPPVIAPSAAAPVAITPARSAPAPQFRDATQAVQAARVAIRANDLSTAQAALAAAQTLQPGNADAQSLQNELKPLTARRDVALQAAQLCASQQLWPCARQHANEALNVDTGNPTARSIVERVIHETGWAPLTPHATTDAPAPARAQPQSQPQSQQAQQAPRQGQQQTQQQAQLQVPLPKGMPADSSPLATTARPSAAPLDPNSVEARERAIRESGWAHAPANSARPAAATAASQ
ncbi:MAG TPA: hypothetical protein VFE79_00100 [Paraburkholderia sp.]|nr:hypothetical protein [Paraburkholderia sp.]